MSSGGEVIPARGVVATSVYCRRCGYNLFGLQADGSCPECGLRTWESIVHTVDPAASKLPRLRNPAMVGNALLWLIACMSAGSMLLVLRPVAQWVDAMDSTGVRDFAGWAPIELSIVAAVVVLASLGGVYRMAPPVRGAPDSAVRDIRLLGAGIMAWSALVTAEAVLEIAGAPDVALDGLWVAVAAAAVVALLGLRGLLRTIGLRSREYRTARGGRQGIRAMIAAIAGTAIGQMLRLIAAVTGSEGLATMGISISVICTLMVVIGLVYLVVNAWWIRRSLRCPPPRLDDVVA